MEGKGYGTSENFIVHMWRLIATKFPFDWILDLRATADWGQERDLYYISFAGATLGGQLVQWEGQDVEIRHDLNWTKPVWTWMIRIFLVGLVVACILL